MADDCGCHMTGARMLLRCVGRAVSVL